MTMRGKQIVAIFVYKNIEFEEDHYQLKYWQRGGAFTFLKTTHAITVLNPNRDWPSHNGLPGGFILSILNGFLTCFSYFFNKQMLLNWKI